MASPDSVTTLFPKRLKFSAAAVTLGSGGGSAGAEAPSIDKSPVAVEYLGTRALDALRQAASERILGEVHFSSPGNAVLGPAYPVTCVDMPQLNEDPLVEVWTSDRPVQCGAFGDVRFAHNGVALFAAISDPVPVDQAAFEQRTAEGYENLFSVMAQQGYPHLLRVWNYFPQINTESLGLENYRRFCRGRGEAFQRQFVDVGQRFPAASALGTRSGQLHIYAIAAREPGVFCENPRQTSAYLYPPEYGPRSPTFARATLMRWDGTANLYISGTASIVGHESRHPGDSVAQLDETLRNIEALLVATGREEDCGFRGLAELSRLKVYLRDAAYLPAVRARLNEVLSPDAQTIFLEADVCRSDLLVEIEAVATVRAPRR